MLETRAKKINLRKKLKLEIALVDDQVDRCIELIVKSAKTDKIGNGKIFASNLEPLIRISTSEKEEFQGADLSMHSIGAVGKD